MATVRQAPLLKTYQRSNTMDEKEEEVSIDHSIDYSASSSGGSDVDSNNDNHSTNGSKGDDSPRSVFESQPYSLMTYMSAKSWSSRFDASCFTVKVESRKTLREKPLKRAAKGVSVGRKKFPAIYYEVQIRFGSHKHVCLRRYSQFKWLFKEFTKNPPKQSLPIEVSSTTTEFLQENLTETMDGAKPEVRKLRMPNATYNCALASTSITHDDVNLFEEQRQDELEEFCDIMLSHPGATFHHAVASFFELEKCRAVAESSTFGAIATGNGIRTPPTKINFPFDVIAVTSPDAAAAKAALAGCIQDLVRYLDDRDNDDLTPKDDTNVSADDYVVTNSGILIVSTTDPFGARCGSGGGTVAALEHADRLYRELDLGDGEGNPSVLIIHAGGDSSRCPTQMALGKAWTSLPVCKRSRGGCTTTATTTRAEISSPTLMLLQMLKRFFGRLPRGSAAVAAGDCLVAFPDEEKEHEAFTVDFDEGTSGGGVVLGLSTPAPLETAKNHGVFLLDDHGLTNGQNETAVIERRPVTKFMQKPTVATLESVTAPLMEGEAKKAWIDTGVVVFLPRAAQTLRLLGGFASQKTSEVLPESVPPLMRPCTESGLEGLYHEGNHAVKGDANGGVNAFAKKTALPIDLYTHIMLGLSTTPQSGSEPCDKEERKRNYVASLEKSLKVIKGDKEAETLSKLYDVFSSLHIQACCVPRGQFCHLGTTRELLDLQCYGVCNSIHADDFDAAQMDTRQKAHRDHCRDFGRSCSLISRTAAFLPGTEVYVDPLAVAVNTIFQSEEVEEATPYKKKNLSSIGARCVLEHCNFTMKDGMSARIGSGCLLSGLRGTFTTEDESKVVPFADNMVVQQTVLKKEWRSVVTPMSSGSSQGDTEASTEFVFCVLGANDPIKDAKTLYGISLDDFFQHSGLTPEDVWPSEDVLPKSKRNIWNAQIHAVVPDLQHDIKVESIFGWVATLMQQNAEFSQAQNQVSLNAWLALPRLSLQQIRAVSDAYAEHSYRHELERNIRRKMTLLCEKIYAILSDNVDVECDTTPFVDSFLGGDSCPLVELVGFVEDVILVSIDHEMYDVTSRCFVVLEGILTDISSKMTEHFAEKLPFREAINSSKTDRVSLSSGWSDSFERAIEKLRAQQSATNKDKNLSLSDCRREGCCEIFSGMKALLESALCWHPPMPWSVVVDHAGVMQTCADYLEEAASALTEVCVCTAKVAVSRVQPPVPVSQWVVATAPGRIDLAGAWSDTPPVTYEHGGAVVCLAVTVDGTKPISARCRRTKQPGCLLITEQRNLADGELSYRDETEVKTLRDVSDFRNPRGTATLLKAALVCLGVVPSVSLLQEDKLDSPIQPFIDAFFGHETNAGEHYGLEVVTTSLLPRGSGMGGSSIIAGSLLAALCRCAGVEIVVKDGESGNENKCQKTQLIQAVSVVEQLMTTGGGWQDQVGGMLPGLKIGRTVAKQIPMKLEVESVCLEGKIRDELNERLVLAFCGAPRLAKDMLRCVIRRWARRTPEVVETVKGLVAGAERSFSAVVEKEDLEQLGKEMFDNWERKKIMVGGDENDEFYGGEPASVRHVLQALKKSGDIIGGTLLGAGGGGFLAMLSRAGRKGSEMEAAARTYCNGEVDIFTWHECRVCNEGLNVTVIDDKTKTTNDSFSLSWHYPSSED